MNDASKKGFVRLLFVTTLLVTIGPQTVSFAGDALTPLDVGQVRVGGEIGRRIDVTINNNLLVLDVEKDFLAPFHDKKSKEGYIGLGKLIDAAVRFAAYSKDEKTLALKKRLINETIKNQESDGYIAMMAPRARMWPLWDIHEMSYIILGLTNNYRYFGERASLDAARKTADYILRHWSPKPDNWPPYALHLCVIGLDRSMLTLYRETKDARYLTFCLQQRGLAAWNQDIVVGRHGKIDGHVYAYLAECLAQLELYRLQPDEKLLRPTWRAIQFIAAQDGMTVGGGVGRSECWTNDQDGSGELGETCATAYQLRVYDSLLRLGGDSRYGDMMERTIFNALFGAQSPDGRRLRYYTPLEGKREFFHLDTYCCPCNYRRIVSELPAMIYYREGPGLAVNLYTKSEAVLDLDRGVSLKVRQETDYPNSGRVVIHLNPAKPAQFPVFLRIPRWCRGATAAVNGKRSTEAVDAATFLRIERTWNAGDQITLDIPMTFRLTLGRKKQAGRVAVMRGPLVFCLNPDQNKSLKDQNASALASLRIDPSSLQEVSGDATIRPCGTACRLRATRNETAQGVSGDVLLKLTEFADPQGKNVYFSLPDLGAAAPDELTGPFDDAKL